LRKAHAELTLHTLVNPASRPLARRFRHVRR